MYLLYKELAFVESYLGIISTQRHRCSLYFHFTTEETKVGDLSIQPPYVGLGRGSPWWGLHSNPGAEALLQADKSRGESHRGSPWMKKSSVLNFSLVCISILFVFPVSERGLLL